MVALAIWICSLPLTGLALYAKQEHMQGYSILLMGWLSPLVLNFAWFANLFFLYGILRLLYGSVPIASSILAALLSLDALRLQQLVLNEGGTTTPVYGYGWGVVLWFLSIFLMLAAVGIRRREASARTQEEKSQEWLLPLGVLLSVATLATVSYYSVHDRMVANPAETERLTNIAFKRGKVCSAHEPIVPDPLRQLRGPLEVVTEKKAVYSNYPFAQIKYLLAWGIPAVRFGKIDYSLIAQSGLLTSEPAVGAPAATIYVTESYLRSIGAKLVETSTNRTVFDQTWERESHPVNTNFYCPDYHSFPTAEQQPRKLLMQALNLHATGDKPDKSDAQIGVGNRVDGVIIGRADVGITRKMKLAQLKDLNAAKKPGGEGKSLLPTDSWSIQRHLRQ